jgi:hypothetical protein
MKKILFYSIVLLPIVFLSCNMDPRAKREQFILEKTQHYIKNKLKCPSTAKFPSEKESRYCVNESGKDTFQIYSWVDSQNTFGAMIRTQFIVKVYEKSGNIKFLEETFFDN